jgi:hypothetical protein
VRAWRVGQLQMVHTRSRQPGKSRLLKFCAPPLLPSRLSVSLSTHTLLQMGREKNLFADTCEASCLAAASLCAEESAAYVRDVYRLPGTYLREVARGARAATRIG